MSARLYRKPGFRRGGYLRLKLRPVAITGFHFAGGRLVAEVEAFRTYREAVEAGGCAPDFTVYGRRLSGGFELADALCDLRIADQVPAESVEA